MKKIFFISLTTLILISVWFFITAFKAQAPKDNLITSQENTNLATNSAQLVKTEVKQTEPESIFSPLFISNLQSNSYPGGEFKIEEVLPDGSNYKQLIVSYLSEGLKIYGLLTIPKNEAPSGGFPAVVFVHGYIPPKEYSTTNSYPSYQATLARSGLITFKPDLRGHGNSEGEAVSAHYSEKYIIDTLYAISYLKEHPEVNPERLGYWGHSNGGQIGLRVVLISSDIKAASLWAGVVGSYEHMFETYNDDIPFLREAKDSPLVRINGLPSTNPDFWRQLDPYYHLNDIKAAIQIQHGTKDDSVPIVLSRHLNDELEKLNKDVEYFEYVGDDHNIGINATAAWQKTIDFFWRKL